MKNITITVSVDGNEVSREFSAYYERDEQDWGTVVVDMLDTITKSTEKKF